MAKTVHRDLMEVRITSSNSSQYPSMALSVFLQVMDWANLVVAFHTLDVFPAAFLLSWSWRRCLRGRVDTCIPENGGSHFSVNDTRQTNANKLPHIVWTIAMSALTDAENMSLVRNYIAWPNPGAPKSTRNNQKFPPDFPITAEGSYKPYIAVFWHF